MWQAIDRAHNQRHRERQNWAEAQEPEWDRRRALARPKMQGKEQSGAPGHHGEPKATQTQTRLKGEVKSENEAQRQALLGRLSPSA